MKLCRVQAEGVLYIENIFLLNLVMNLYLLRLTGRILKKASSFARCLVSSMVGGIGYCMILCIPGASYTAKVMLGMVPVGMLMIYLALQVKGIKQLCYGTGWMFCFAFLLGGFIIFLKGKSPFLEKYVRQGIIVAGMGFIGCEIIKKGLDNWQQRMKRQFCKVRLMADVGEVEVRALIDTGNGLTDPITHKPVAILEEGIWKGMQSRMRPEKYRVIPFHSVGKEHGMLEAYEIEEMVVEDDVERCRYQQVIIAVFKGRISKSGSYRMIVPSELSI